MPAPKIGFRWIGLLLLIAGYLLIVGMFGALALSPEMTAREAYEQVDGPLMAWLGGSLVLAKDLIVAYHIALATKEAKEKGPWG